MTLNLIATATFGLEAIVAREVQRLGYTDTRTDNGRVMFPADEQAIALCNLWLRSSDRVLIEMARFKATDFGQLFDQTVELPWERWIPADGRFPVRGKSIQSQLSSVPACQKIVKKAVVERLKKAHRKDWFDETGAEYAIEVALLKDEVTLSLDTTGAGLHKRGYRKLQGAAPLKETLAAALVALSYWQPDRPLVDPFCGTGTIPIEAAMIGRNIAPGLKRSFASETWPTMTAEHWTIAREDAHDSIRPALSARIIGTDLDENVLSLARYHAKQAGVEEDIHWQQRPFVELRGKHDYGCVITNPPYGMRLGEDAYELRDLYETMPAVFARLKTWSIYVLTAFENFEQVIGQQADRRRKLYNGRIECTYYQFHGPKPGEAITRSNTPATESQHEPPFKPDTAVENKINPAFGGIPEGSQRQAEDFANRLRKRARHLRRWPQRGITCYRLYERDVPDVPLVVDRYEDCLHVAEYERPNEHTGAQHHDWIELMLRTAGEALELPREKVFFKERKKQRGNTQHERIARNKQNRIVNEGGLKFIVNLSDYIDTGLFLDHRITRDMVRREAKGKRFLNLFCYTGSFTVYAAAGGAASSLSVDLSGSYLDWARENLSLNNLAGKQHRGTQADILTFLRKHEKPEPGKGFYDLAVVDPPTFSNSKTTENDWEVQRDHVELLDLVYSLLAPGGAIYFSTNFRKFHMHWPVENTPAAQTAQVKEISKQTVPEDFRNQRIHRCWRIEKNGG